jgi:hypothetical protein
MTMEKGWNDTDRGKQNYSEKNLSQCHLVHHKSHTYWPWIELGHPQQNKSLKLFLCIVLHKGIKRTLLLSVWKFKIPISISTVNGARGGAVG